MKKLFAKIRNKLIRRTIPKVNSFEEAKNFCEVKNPNGYESKMLCKYRFEKFDRHIKQNKKLFFSPSINMLLYSISYFLKINKGKIPKIIDFGGACGENIIFLESIFGEDIYNKFWVVETRAQVRESKKWEFSKKINFLQNIDELISTQKIDIFFSSCSLNYTKNPYGVLSSIAKAKIPMICLTRNNFSENPRPFIQLSNLSDNGVGNHLEKYKESEVWYPAQSLSEFKIKNLFLSREYKLIIDETIDKTGIINKKDNYAKDLFFNLIV